MFTHNFNEIFKSSQFLVHNNNVVKTKNINILIIIYTVHIYIFQLWLLAYLNIIFCYPLFIFFFIEDIINKIQIFLYYDMLLACLEWPYRDCKHIYYLDYHLWIGIAWYTPFLLGLRIVNKNLLHDGIKFVLNYLQDKIMILNFHIMKWFDLIYIF